MGSVAAVAVAPASVAGSTTAADVFFVSNVVCDVHKQRWINGKRGVSAKVKVVDEPLVLLKHHCGNQQFDQEADQCER